MQPNPTTATLIPSPYARDGARLVDMGYSAIPVMPGSKRPGSMSHGQWYGDMGWSRFCDRLPTGIETEIWTRWADAGVCIALDRSIKVIDVDTDDAAIRAAIEAVIPDSPVKKKGAKGYSAFFRGSDAIVSRPFTLVLAGGFEARIIDLLAHGRQTVLPPTVHPDIDQPYQWITDDTLLDTSPDALPTLPDDIADLLAAALEPFGEVQTYKSKARSGEEIFGDTIWREVNQFALANLDSWVPALFGADAKRNRDGSYRARAFWRDVENSNVGIHPDGIMDWGDSKAYTPIDLVMAVNATPAGYFEVAYDWLKNRTGYDPGEAEWLERAKASAALLSERSRAREAAGAITLAATHTVTAHPTPTTHQPPALPVTIATAPPVRAPRGHIDPFTPAAVGGLIGAIMTWAMETARRPVPEFAMLTAVSFVATMFGRQAIGPTGLGLNLYMVGVAGPGFGKEHTHKALQTLALDCGLHFLIGPGEVTSGSAIEKIARKRPVFVMPWDEIGVVLQSVNGFNASSWAKTIRKVWLELFSKSTSVWSGKEHADPTKDSSADPIHCPTVSVLGVSTPTTFYKGLTEDSLTDGFIARLIVIEAKTRPGRHVAPAVVAAPPPLIAAVKKAVAGLPGGPLAKAGWRNPSIRPTLYTVPWADDEAERRWQAIEDWQIEQIEEHEAHDGLIGRTAEHVIKLATVRALSRDPSLPAVTVSDVEWAYAFVQRSIDCIETGAKEYMAGSIFEELCKAIMRALTRAGGEMAHSNLVRAKGVSKADDRMVRAALERLVLAGEILKPTLGGRGMKIKMATGE